MTQDSSPVRKIIAYDPINDVFEYAGYEQYSKGFRSIQQDHAKIHDGKGFSCSNKIPSIAASGSFDLLLNNPAGNWPHLRFFKFNVDTAPCDVFLYESVTVSANGTACTPYNYSRSSSNTPSLAIHEMPNVTTPGTQIDYELIESLSQKGGGSLEEIETEWILRPEFKYLLRVTNNTVGVVAAAYKLFWYEGFD